MTKWRYAIYMIFVAFSLVSLFFFDRNVLAGELALYILLTLLLLRKLWKGEHAKKETPTDGTPTSLIQTHDNAHYAEIDLNEQKLWLKKREQIMKDEAAKLQQTAVYKRFVSFLNNPSKTLLADADWEELIANLECSIPNFRIVRFETEQISKDCYRLCVLIRYGFKPSEIALIMGKTTSFITKTRQFLLHKIYQVSGTAQEFDVRLLDIF